ncbi:MAG: hypothetical protein KDB53_03300, partial [Planctomycetes bacterium]|nr:hypothetical protein [Planctomycetota bacterium]
HRAAMAERRDWVREAAAVDVKVGARYAHVETEHFLVHSCIPEWRFDRLGKRDRDEAAHLYALRLEKLADRFKEVVGRLPEKRGRIFLQWDMEQELKATQEFGPFAARTALRGFVDKDLAWFGFPAFESLYRDQGLQSYLVHNAAHLLVEGLFDYQMAPPWLSVGVAHFFEQDAFEGKKDCTNFCSERVSYKSKWASGSAWAKLLAKEAGRNKDLGLVELAALKPEDLGAREHAYAFAWAGFFLLREAAQRDLILDALVARQPVSELPGLLGLDETSLKKEWRAHLTRLR